MSNHTPTPWEVGEDVGQAERSIVTAECRDICTCETGFGDAEANAEFIVRAVNAHDDLLNACREILRADEYTPDWHVTDAIELAKAAIAKATT